MTESGFRKVVAVWDGGSTSTNWDDREKENTFIHAKMFTVKYRRRVTWLYISKILKAVKLSLLSILTLFNK